MKSRKSRGAALTLLTLICIGSLARAQDAAEVDPRDEVSLDEPTPTPTPAPGAKTPEELRQEEFFKMQVEKLFKKGTTPKNNDESKKSSSHVDVTMPVYFGNQVKHLGLVNTKLNPETNDMQVDGYVFMTQLRRIVSGSWFTTESNARFQEFESNPDANKWLSIREFSGSGLRVEYNEAKLEIRVFVPPELRRVRASSLRKPGVNLDLDDYDSPSFFSSFLNIEASETFTTAVAGSDGRSPLRAELNGAVNLGGTVVEANASYTEIRDASSTEKPIERGNVRLVRDFPSVYLRMSLGDLIYPVGAFQSFRPIGGVAFTREFNLQPSTVTYPTGEYEVFLQRPSRVEVWINEQLQQVIRLPAGRHVLRDFPFYGGMNDIRLEITDDVGRTETKTYSFFSNTELLGRGVNRFSYAVGAPWDRVDQERVYDTTRLTTSVTHSVGLSESFTLGAGYQGDPFQNVATLHSLVSTRIGFFRLEGGRSAAATGSEGYAAGLRYLFLDSSSAARGQRTFNLGASYTGQGFTSLGALAPTAHPRMSFTASYTQPIRRDLSLSAGGDYDISSPANGFRLSLGISKRFPGNVSTSLRFTHQRATTGVEELRLFGFLTWSFPDQQQALSASFDNSNDSKRISWTHSPSSGANTFNTEATLEDEPGEKSYKGRILYTGNRSRTTASHEVVVPSLQSQAELGPGALHSTTLQFGTALVMAGTSFAITRPVSNSFAIIDPIKNLRGRSLDIDPQSDGRYAARTDWLGANALPELHPYAPNEIKIRPSNSETAAPPKDHFSVYPTYKSGFAYKIGTDAVVYLTMLLLTEDGGAVKLAAIQAYSVANPNAEPITSFTNSKGLMRSEGFRPGRYRFEITGTNFEPFEVDILETDTDAFDAGNIIVKARQE